MRINNDNMGNVLFFPTNTAQEVMCITIRLIKEAVGVPYEYIEDADQCKTAIGAIYGILRAAEAIEEVLRA